MRILMSVTACALLASCAQPGALQRASAAQEPTGRVAGNPQSCISTNPQQNLHAIDRSTLAYGSGRTIFINRLGAPCPGIEPTSTLIVQPGTPGEYCRGDLVRGREMDATIAGPVCVLRDWIPYRAR